MFDPAILKENPSYLRVISDEGRKKMSVYGALGAKSKETFWTEERIEQLKQLAATKICSRAIAAQMGISKNAVIGKLYRTNTPFGVPKKKRDPNAPKKEKKHFSFRRGKPKPAFLRDVLTVPTEPEPLRVSLIDLENAHCHWVCDATDDRCLPTYCGHPTIRESKWCNHHFHRVYA